MTITYIPSTVTIEHEELQGSPSENHSDRGFSAVRTLKCKWDERETFAEQLMGGGLLEIDGENSVLKTGALYPSRTDTQVVGISVKGFFDKNVKPDPGLGTQVAAYDDAQFTVQYDNFFDRGDEPGGGDGDGNQNTEESIDSFTEFLTGPPFKICDASGGYSPSDPSTWAINDANTTKLVTGFEWVFTRRQQPGVGSASFNLMGHVNGAAIISRKLNFPFPLESLLYKGVSMRSGRAVNGILNWDISFRLGFRGFDNANWNKIWDFKQSKWIEPVRCNDAVPIKTYPTGDLASLVQPNINP